MQIDREGTKVLERLLELEKKLEIAVNEKDEEIESKNVKMEEMRQRSMAELQKARDVADIVDARTRAMSAQTLSPMSHFSVGVQSGEVGFDHWLEQLEVRAKLVGWSDVDKNYQLKMLLD